MEAKTLGELRQVAVVSGSETIGAAIARSLTRSEKLQRWAAVLEENPSQSIKPLVRIEFLPRQERMFVRRDDSPITIAYRDPVLRAAGLAGDTLGDAVKFFKLSDHEAHYLVCDCHYHRMAMTPELVAKRVRTLANQVTLRNVWERIRAWF